MLVLLAREKKEKKKKWKRKGVRYMTKSSNARRKAVKKTKITV